MLDISADSPTIMDDELTTAGFEIILDKIKILNVPTKNQLDEIENKILALEI